MNNLCATVNKILPFSCVDGPGNRLVIFLQGCNFRCQNCHNPYTIGVCNHCGDCVQTCPHHALSIQNNRVVWQPERCQQCDTCLQTCPHSASPMIHTYHVEELMTLIRQYAVFLNGITISGGEATLQLPFIVALFTAIKHSDDLKHLTCFVDSNGYLSATGWEKLLPVMDGAMIDLKAWTSERHQMLTGKDNLRVLNSLQLLAAAKKLYEVRLLLIPHYTDLMTHLAPLAEFLKTLSPDLAIRLNAFQTHGVKGEASHWPKTTQQEIEHLAQRLTEFGLKNITTPTVYL